MSKYWIWDFWAARYETLWVQKYSLRPTRELVVKEIKTLIQDAAGELNLLDVGCGTGQLAEDLAKSLPDREIRFTGLDFSPAMVEQAKGKEISKAVFCTGNAEALPFGNGEFDLVTCSHSFPYYGNKLQALREFVRVLKPGGSILLVQASVNNPYDRLVMGFVKLTTGKAEYPSAGQTEELLARAGAKLLKQVKPDIRPFMPSIILSVARTEERQ